MKELLYTLLIATAGIIGLAGVSLAEPGDSINGGGQIVTDGAKISFGGFASQGGAAYFEGQWQVNFHDVTAGSIADKSKFHSTAITDMEFFAGNSGSCIAAMNMTIDGKFNGEPDWSMIFRAGDAGRPNEWDFETADTIRVQLFNPSGVEVYDTFDHDFLGGSDCVGSARTALDRGNVTIELYY